MVWKPVITLRADLAEVVASAREGLAAVSPRSRNPPGVPAPLVLLCMELSRLLYVSKFPGDMLATLILFWALCVTTCSVLGFPRWIGSQRYVVKHGAARVPFTLFNRLYSCSDDFVAAITRFSENLPSTKIDVASIKSNVAYIKSSVASIKSDLASIKSDLAMIKKSLDRQEEITASLVEDIVRKKASATFGNCVHDLVVLASPSDSEYDTFGTGDQ